MYDRLSRYYDLSHTALTDDIPFMLGLAAETGGPILELGCGSGRLLLPLAREGRRAPLALGLALLLPLLPLADGLLSPLLQNLLVNPQELERELPYLARSIRARAVR